MVLPLDPRAAAAVACTTPSATDAQNVDVMELFGGGDPLTDGDLYYKTTLITLLSFKMLNALRYLSQLTL